MNFKKKVRLRRIVGESIFTSFWMFELGIGDNNFIIFNSSNATGKELNSTGVTSQIDSLNGNVTVTLVFISKKLKKKIFEKFLKNETNREKRSMIDQWNTDDSTIFSTGQ